MWWGLSISRWKKGLIQQHSPWGFQQVSFLSYPRFFLLDSWKKQPLQWWQRVHVAWNPLTIADLTAVPTEGANCQCCCSLVTKLCLNPCNLTDCSLAGSSVHGILQARTLEWVAISFSREASWPTDWTQLFCNGRQILYHWATREAHSRGQIQAPIEHHSQHWWAEGTSQPPRWYTGEFPSWGEKQSVLIKIDTSSGCKFVFLVLDFSIRSS